MATNAARFAELFLPADCRENGGNEILECWEDLVFFCHFGCGPAPNNVSNAISAPNGLFPFFPSSVHVNDVLILEDVREVLARKDKNLFNDPENEDCQMYVRLEEELAPIVLPLTEQLTLDKDFFTRLAASKAVKRLKHTYPMVLEFLCQHGLERFQGNPEILRFAPSMQESVDTPRQTVISCESLIYLAHMAGCPGLRRDAYDCLRNAFSDHFTSILDSLRGVLGAKLEVSSEGTVAPAAVMVTSNEVQQALFAASRRKVMGFGDSG